MTQRSRRTRTGKLAVKLALISSLAGFAVCASVAVIIVGRLEGTVEDPEYLRQTYVISLVLAFVAGGVVGGVVFGVASGIGSRLTDLSLAVSKMGRGTPTQVRVTGSDEATILGRAVSALGSDLAGLRSGGEEDTASLGFDPQVREFRDKTVSESFEAPEGYEVDGAITAGSRGGTEYFDIHTGKAGTVALVLSASGNSVLSLLAVRMARDEILRALGAGAGARKALSHTNRVMYRNLPRGVCALATLLEIGEAVKLYQAGCRVPVVVCAAGELSDVMAEGLALGLDSGPVFEKGLRSEPVLTSPGVRIVLLNEAGDRNEDLIESIRNHSPKHTVPFMSMVLGDLDASLGTGGLREDVILVTVKKT